MRKTPCPSQADGMQHIVEMFGTAADLARSIGIHRAAVFRWQTGERPLQDRHKKVIIEAAHKLGLDMERAAWALNVERCDCCGTIIDKAIRELCK